MVFNIFKWPTKDRYAKAQLENWRSEAIKRAEDHAISTKILKTIDPKAGNIRPHFAVIKVSTDSVEVVNYK